MMQPRRRHRRRSTATRVSQAFGDYRQLYALEIGALAPRATWGARVGATRSGWR